ncbi:hypothetical protein L6452_24147 [Arctium lappa]|uniref:Uncharacterized protein n=1 Tax=Arctium lappa TaxID=4217 RepID=A0ACB9A9D8_ARCLA|nr:hypothetical protein L6452_24147 [Arctium lappa]
MSNTTTTAIVLLLLLVLHVASSAGRPLDNHLISANAAANSVTMSLEPRDQDFATQKRPSFNGKEVSGCMPKGRRHSSAPSRYVNNQPLFHSLGCNSITP